MMRFWVLGSALAMAIGFAGATMAGQPNAHDFEFQSIDGKALKLADWKGKPVLVVNTASLCGYTKQYAGLQQLWSAYEAKGLIVLGVPSNDFGGQEPKAEGEIKKFCEGAFGVTFPMTSKYAVTGPSAHPFYKWAASTAGSDGAPGWNFHKYLVGVDGKLVQAFPSQVRPDDKNLIAAIDRALAAK